LFWIRDAEQILWHVGDLRQSVENMDKQIVILVARAGPRELGAVDLEAAIGSGKQDETINIIYEIKQLTDNRDLTIAFLAKVEDVLEAIDAEESCREYVPVLRAWYFDRTTKERIAENVGYSHRNSIYEIRRRALRKFAIKMFGLGALMNT
jgi:hypothetical protein